MANTRAALQRSIANIDESIGEGSSQPRPQLSPVASEKDAGRTPLRSFGIVEVDRVIPDPNQPRTQIDDDEIKRLADSMASGTGQLQPITARWSAQHSKWVIISGERRWRAAKAAGLKRIACQFREDDQTESEIREQQLVENLLRENLAPMDEARGYSALMELSGFNGKQVAEKLHVNPSRVSRALALLDLPHDIQAKIEAGELPPTVAYELTKLDSEDVQYRLAEQAATGSLSHKDTVKAVRTRRGKKARTRRPQKLTFKAGNGIPVIVGVEEQTSYHDIEVALREAIDEVLLRITNNVQLY